MRLIDADEAYKVLTDYYHHKTEIQHKALKEALSRVPTVDIDAIMEYVPTVDPVKHGHWIEHDVGLICSECGHYTESMYDEPFNNKFGKGWALKRPYYCGYCGAKNEVEE